MNIIMYPHGGSGNRGCEAIVRGTERILHPSKSILFTSCMSEDKNVDLDKVCILMHERSPIKRMTLDYFITFLKFHIMKNKNAFDILVFNNIFKNCTKDTIALSIGGDNYCYGEASYIYLINKELRKKGVKTILWGCSVDELQLTEKMKQDLQNYTLIVARESITYESMKKINSNVVLYPDPAFQLDKIELPLPNGFVEGNTIGINVSPMIIDNEKNKGMTLKNYIALIEYIMENTDMHIALIPHVIWNFNDDRKPIQLLHDKFKNTNRIFKIDGLPAEQIKGYIAKCRIFIGARTHSTIAAYSSCVPTLVVGYSIKAKGIAKDIFGTDENYVIPVQSLNQENDLTDAFKWIYQNEVTIRNHLTQFMPNYCKKALDLKEVIDKL